MRQTRCCPGDCTIRSDWEKELRGEIDLVRGNRFKEAIAVLKVLSHPSRLKIVMLLLSRDHCVCEINYVLDEPQNMVSYNLGMLKKYGIVESYNHSKHKFYRLNDDAVAFIRQIKEHLVEG